MWSVSRGELRLCCIRLHRHLSRLLQLLGLVEASASTRKHMACERYYRSHTCCVEARQEISVCLSKV